MTESDPTALSVTMTATLEQEWSVEDLADAIDEPSAEANGAARAHVAVATRPVQVMEEGTVPAIARPLPGAIPISPLGIAKRAVSGRYRSGGVGFQLELRVDVDGKRPTRRVSGDFFYVSGATMSYFGSFVVPSPTVTVGTSAVVIDGVMSATWNPGFPRLRVTIPRVLIIQPQPAATAQFLGLTGAAGAAYICAFQSPYFRTVQYEQDCVQAVQPFVSYNTGSLPSGGAARELTVVRAYNEAGIDFQTAGISNVIPLTGVGPSWSDGELHASMLAQFSLWREAPQWKVWLLAANLHDLGSGLRGIMFDQRGKQRQGCAVFHTAMGGGTLEATRGQLRTYVHELGHCFNLLHSWQKSLAVPPAPNRPDAKSWMNYVQNYPGGAAAYWAAFAFEFDDLEVIHLRHGFRNNVIPGGNDFTIGAALVEPEALSRLVSDESRLRIEIEATRPSYGLGEPVVVEVKLYTEDMRGRRVTPNLHPKAGFVQIGIRKPGGQIQAFRPLIQHCFDSESVILDAERPSIYESAYIGYGHDGFTFDEPGIYELRAIYYAPDGSAILSQSISLRVRSPKTDADDAVADLLFGDEQGQLLALLGSDAPDLQPGVHAFDEILAKYPDHQLAVYPRLVMGMNDSREFKLITPSKELRARKPRADQAVKQLSSVVKASEAGLGVDNITLGQAMERLACAHHELGNDKAARDTAAQLVTTFERKNLKPHVLTRIRAQSAALAAEFGAAPRGAAKVSSN